VKLSHVSCLSMIFCTNFRLTCVKAPFLGIPPSFMTAGAGPLLYAAVQAIVEYLPDIPELTGELELPLSLVDGFTRAYLVCSLIPPSVTQHQSSIIASSPWTLLVTSLVSAMPYHRGIINSGLQLCSLQLMEDFSWPIYSQS